MATKTSIKVKCDSVVSNSNSSLARFAIELPPAPAAKPGEPAKRMAKTILTFAFTTPHEATAYTVGKTYTVTVEESK